MEKKENFVEQITSRDEDFSQWYTDICLKAELSDYSSVKGCMVVRPLGTALWENITKVVDDRLKATGHQNVMMPLLIPERLLLKEAEHVEGFAPEVAWVTAGGDTELSERLAIRPTSEVLFCEHFQKIIHSYRDLPVLYNQWVSVMRWEKTTRPFLRTTEFFWQEGHTCHVDYEDADREALEILDMYVDVCENILAIPVVSGVKSESEKFAGAVKTYTNETLMYDGKALQITTSHHLGDNFGKAFNINYLDKNGDSKFVNTTSWAITTRAIGGMIMVHSDDRGLVLPPRIAPVQVNIVPISQHQEGVLDKAYELKEQLSQDVTVQVDASDKKPGWKFSESEMRGFPIRIEIGPRDIAEQTLVVVRRDTLEKTTIKWDDQLNENIKALLDDIHNNMFNVAKERQDKRTRTATTKEEFAKMIEEGGFVIAPWSGDLAVEEQIKEETGATSRCLSFENVDADLTGVKDLWNGQDAKYLMHWAKAY
ncbi:proline--tRNA ligase [Vagococcus acidifermentans]|uniref:Proline--tRNA ligase n=1 Tax=Vagococcus acidifermentans TaxID=564710 RepID=A0A430B264_9ENTE|nr:proline--tRNA ligase [Vagococcus acidifermentans]RSU14416.1 proline--tRNA ligase [Vagococcus acidifermentans]